MEVAGQRPSWNELASDQIGRNEHVDRFMVALARMVFEASFRPKWPGGWRA